MKSKTTPTMKLLLLPNGGLEIVIIDTRLAFPPRHSEKEPIILDDRETQALKDFLNEPDPAST